MYINISRKAHYYFIHSFSTSYQLYNEDTQKQEGRAVSSFKCARKPLQCQSGIVQYIPRGPCQVGQNVQMLELIVSGAIESMRVRFQKSTKACPSR